MLPQWNCIYTISITGTMFCSKIVKLGPVLAPMHLAIARGEVTECVQGCVVGIAQDILEKRRYSFHELAA